MAVAEKKKRSKMLSKKGELDGVYLVLLCILVCSGLLMLISASTPDLIGTDTPYKGIIKNCAFAVVGFLAMLITANLTDYKNYRPFIPFAYYVSLIIMYLTPFIGVESQGATRWISLGGAMTIQPSEIMKVTMILYMADIMTRGKNPDLENKNLFIKLLYKFRFELIFIIPAGGAVLQSHLSGAIIICAIGFTMLLAYGMPKSHIFGIGALGLSAVAFLAIKEPYRLNRLIGYKDPEADLLGTGWQIVQSLYAICSGGLFGVGFGQSRQKYNWLPEASNDYIFAVLCEEMGIIGGLTVMALFGVFVWRGIKIALNARELFGTLIAFGVSAMIGLQVIINIGVVTKLLPSTGMQLPFFSSGGTSLIFMLIATGIVLNISRYQKKGAGLIHEVK